MTGQLTGYDIWSEYKRLRDILTELEGDLMTRSTTYAKAIRDYRDAKAEAWLEFVDEKSATARRDATDNAVSTLKGAMEAAEVERDVVRERIWNTRAQLGLIDDVAGVVRSEIRMAGSA